jgi:hypothetical protein
MLYMKVQRRVRLPRSLSARAGLLQNGDPDAATFFFADSPTLPTHANKRLDTLVQAVNV